MMTTWLLDCDKLKEQAILEVFADSREITYDWYTQRLEILSWADAGQ